MLQFFITVISEILMSINLSRPLCFASVVVVLFLFSSPGTIATILGAGTKLGILSFALEKKEEE